MGDIAQRGNRLTAAKGGRIGKFGGGRTNLLEELGGVEAEPSNRNRRAEISRVHGELNRGYKKGKRVIGLSPVQQHYVQHGYGPHKRKGKAIGGAIKKVIQGGKKIISKIKGKGKKGLGSGIKPSEMREIIPKGDRKLYLKEKLANPHKRIGKAAGGRIGKLTGGMGHSDKGTSGGWVRRPRTGSKLHEVLGGGERGKPHSTSEGRQAAGKRFLKRTRRKALDDMHDEAWAGRDPEKGKPHSSKEGRIAGGRQNFKRWAKQVQGLKKGGKVDKKWIQKAVDPKHKGYCTPMTKKTCTPARKALARTFKKKAKTGW